MVYFVRAGEYVKIGVANNIHSRMSALQTGCPHELECVLLLNGSYDLEMEVHQRFRSTHHRGEWFVWSDDLADYMNEMRELGEDMSGITRLGPADDLSEMEDFGEYVKRLREMAGLSIMDVAKMLGISKTSAAAVENRPNPGLDTMRRHLRLFGAKYTVA
ncbi:MAG: GIY-YIG nuclease family protein [Gemmatimonadota bacterium]|jgi:DNA-binding XRE family transcriptional regulator